MPKPDLSLVPRRVTTGVTLHLFPEPRRAWRVPLAAPFDVETSPSWLIVGMTFAYVSTVYEIAPLAARDEAHMMYDAAVAEAERAASSCTVRYVPAGAIEGDFLHPDAVAFSQAEAAARAQEHRAAAG